jgi:hypothetical protein
MSAAHANEPKTNNATRIARKHFIDFEDLKYIASLLFRFSRQGKYQSGLEPVSPPLLPYFTSSIRPLMIER